MIRRTPVRVRWPWLLGAALLFAANVAWLVSFEVLYVRRAEAREKVVEANGEKIAALRADLAGRREGLDRIRSLGADRTRFYGEILGSPEDRFTERVRRIRELAAGAKLRISELSFSEQSLEVIPVRVVEIDFSTDGSYAELKRFLNSVEVDGQFLAVSSIALTRNDPASGRAEVGFRVVLETAFHDPAALRRTGLAKVRP